jgi:tetratricopeptide (TPR) repeat protein
VAYETLPHNLRGELHRRAAATTDNREERARHLDRAAEYLATDSELAQEAAEALADQGEQLIAVYRHRDASRVLERSVALGCRRPSALFALGRLQGASGQHAEALTTLNLVEDDPADAAVAIERDHTAANTAIFDDPTWAAPRLDAVAERWHAAGNIAKEAWAHANAGVAYFNVSRMSEAVCSLERALELFELVEDESGLLATTSFLCIAKPTDVRVPTWLTHALEFADAAGDRGKMVSTLSTLTWNNFFRSFCGDPADVAAAEGFARRLADLSEELGALDTTVHAWSLLVVMARLSGRIREASERAAELQRVLGSVQGSDSFLGWAAAYCAAVAGGASGATPPFPPAGSMDPVVRIAGALIEAELILAGRFEEALERLERPDRPDLGVMGDLVGVFRALAFVLTGREAEAAAGVDRAFAAAARLKASAAMTAAAALRAEIQRDASLLPPLPLEVGGLADLLVMRAHVVCGASVTDRELQLAAVAMAAPGLTRGLPGT